MDQPLPNAKPAATRPKGNGLAVTGLVFSCLFFVPLLPLIGLVLGIVALATGRHKTISIVAICLGAFFTFFIGIEAAVAIPTFMRYVRRAKSHEATRNVTNIAADIAALDAAAWSKLPDSDWTPPDSACKYAGAKYPINAALWDVAPWQTMSFRIAEPSHYQYRVRRSDQGFLVEAQGDLDCDGELSHFSRPVAPDGVGELRSENEME